MVSCPTCKKNLRRTLIYINCNVENGGTLDWNGDGFCDDLNNIEDCNFDDGDCCGLSVERNFCVDCTCKCKQKENHA